MDSIRAILQNAGLISPNTSDAAVLQMARSPAGRQVLADSGVDIDTLDIQARPDELAAPPQAQTPPISQTIEPRTTQNAPITGFIDQILGRNQQPAAPPPPPAASPTDITASNPESAISEDELDPETKARIGLLNAQAAKAQADAAAAQAAAGIAGSETAKQTAALQLEQAKAQAARAAYELQQALSGISPEAQIRLTDQLAIEREKLRQGFEAQKSVAEAAEARALQQDQANAALARTQQEIDARAAEGAADRFARREEVIGTQAITLRGQELDRLQAENDFVLRMMANKISAGELSLNAASKKYDAYLSRARLPSEILKNTTQAMEPFIPYMTSMKKGDIPVGFERGGPVESLYKMFGGSYDPKTFAANPVKFDLLKAGSDAGANWSQSGKVPDPGSIFNISIPDTNATSALSQAPALPTPLSASMTGSGVDVGTMPAELKNRIGANLGG